MIQSDTLTPRTATFSALVPQAPDALLALMAMHRADPRPERVDLGIGVYKDTSGRTPVMAAVKSAEQQLWQRQDTKSYLGAEGDTGFCTALAPIVLGAPLAGSGRFVGVQTPGGTGALRLGAELIAHARPQARIWLGNPSWPNHAPIFRGANLDVRPHTYFDPASGRLNFDGMMADLAAASPGDVLLVQACCHNPTGADLDAGQWAALTAFVVERGLLPLLDFAYQGLGDGLEQDAGGMRGMLDACPEALVAYSCDKNFGLYRDRVGALWVMGERAEAIDPIRGAVLAIARALWSMPPDHGAAAVRYLLESTELRAEWRGELETMRTRINDVRERLGAMHPRLAPIAGQRGMFAMLPITPAEVATLRTDHAIYMADNGRINVAGLTLDNVDRVAAAIVPLLRTTG